jgi:hypothetical protein
LSAAAIEKINTYGSARFTGYANGSWYIDGKKKGKDLSTADMAKISVTQGTISNSLANQSLTAQSQEKELALKQSNAALETSQANLGILSQQLEDTKTASAASTELQAQKTLIDEAQARTAAAEANRAGVLSQQEGRMAIAKSTRMRNRAAARQKTRATGLLSTSARPR